MAGPFDKKYKMWVEDSRNLHQLFSGSSERRDDGLKAKKEYYKSYKESYVKNVQFEPEKLNPG